MADRSVTFRAWLKKLKALGVKDFVEVAGRRLAAETPPLLELGKQWPRTGQPDGMHLGEVREVLCTHLPKAEELPLDPEFQDDPDEWWAATGRPYLKALVATLNAAGAGTSVAAAAPAGPGGCDGFHPLGGVIRR